MTTNETMVPAWACLSEQDQRSGDVLVDIHADGEAVIFDCNACSVVFENHKDVLSLVARVLSAASLALEKHKQRELEAEELAKLPVPTPPWRRSPTYVGRLP